MGTVVNSQRIKSPQLLCHGSEVKVGSLRILYKHPGRSPEAQAPALEQALEALCHKQKRRKARADVRRRRKERIKSSIRRIWRPDWFAIGVFAMFVLGVWWLLYSRLEAGE